VGVISPLASNLDGTLENTLGNNPMRCVVRPHHTFARGALEDPFWMHVRRLEILRRCGIGSGPKEGGAAPWRFDTPQQEHARGAMIK
jgi:hypothetical protein